MTAYRVEVERLTVTFVMAETAAAARMWVLEHPSEAGIVYEVAHVERVPANVQAPMYDSARAGNP